jgi:hypothetical protein
MARKMKNKWYNYLQWIPPWYLATIPPPSRAPDRAGEIECLVDAVLLLLVDVATEQLAKIVLRLHVPELFLLVFRV